ncbi:MAG: hypothetical protein JNL80_15815 [Phycisphaerae bacterium]|jgi:hypothetical protein|nr:hypothetical protein [Phycisphaerae bacterium]
MNTSTPRPLFRHLIAAVAAASLSLSIGCAGDRAAADGPGSSPLASQDSTAPSRPSLSRDASVTIYPVSLAGRPMAQVGEVVGMFLERGGMEHLELTQREFPPVKDRDLQATATAFAAHVAKEAIATDYALYCEYLGTPGRSVDEVRTILVSRAGEVLWADSQTKKDSDFQAVSPGEPMECCVLVSKRLQPIFHFDDPNRAGATEGKLAKRWKSDTGLPGDDEQAAIEARAKLLRSAMPKASIVVYPPHVPSSMTAKAADLSQRLIEQGVANAQASPTSADVKVRYGMNEQMVLWGFARNFSAFLRTNPPQADYALLADYLFTKNANGETVVIGVHFTVCDKTGEIVLVDFQNSHQPDFQATKPATPQDCDRLVAKRLASLLK